MTRKEPDAMVESAVITRVSPAAHLAMRFAAAEVTGPRAVRLRELPFQTMVGLRVTPGTPAAGRVEAALGTALPARCGQVAAGQGCSALWLAPDEFLVLSSDQPDAETAVLVEALGDEPGSAVDLSANRTTLELSGLSARAVLEKGCALDLHPREFAAGTAYVTLIGSVPVILCKVEEETYRILPRSSFADFLGRWLIDAMAEFTEPELT
jgi:sarcosine oxidase subunit gamma